jgi:DnaJ-class molecular chaperone
MVDLPHKIWDHKTGRYKLLKCETCDGTGKQEDGTADCNDCLGTGIKCIEGDHDE